MPACALCAAHRELQRGCACISCSSKLQLLSSSPVAAASSCCCTHRECPANPGCAAHCLGDLPIIGEHQRWAARRESYCLAIRCHHRS